MTKRFAVRASALAVAGAIAVTVRLAALGMATIDETLSPGVALADQRYIECEGGHSRTTATVEARIDKDKKTVILIGDTRPPEPEREPYDTFCVYVSDVLQWLLRNKEGGPPDLGTYIVLVRFSKFPDQHRRPLLTGAVGPNGTDYKERNDGTGRIISGKVKDDSVNGEYAYQLFLVDPSTGDEIPLKCIWQSPRPGDSPSMGGGVRSGKPFIVHD